MMVLGSNDYFKFRGASLPYNNNKHLVKVGEQL